MVGGKRLMKKLLILNVKKYDGVFWYRVEQFRRKTKELNLIDAQYLSSYLGEEKLAEVIKKADAYFMIYGWVVEMLFLDEILKKRGNKPLIVDVDDKVDEVNLFSDLYQTYGTKEVRLTNGLWLWKNGVNGFDVEKNKKRIEKVFNILKEADLVITTTFKMKEWVENFNKKVVVIPNCIDQKFFPCLEKKEEKIVKVGWAGGASHFEDLMTILPSLKKIMEKYPHVEYYQIGQWFGVVEKYIPKSRLKHYGWVNADGHGYRQACLNLDIGLCPLTPQNFNLYKSSIKFYEYSATKTATLAFNSLPYCEDIIEGENGLLYSTPDEFEKKLEFLILNPVKRRLLAQKAYDYVLKYRNLDEIAKDWALVINELIKAKNENLVFQQKS